MSLLKRYSIFIGVAALIGLILLINKETGMRAVNTTLLSFKEMFLILPPIFVLLGLLDVWVPRETMIKYLGEESGVKGMLIAILIGSAAAGPLYGAFPVALVLMKKRGPVFQYSFVYRRVVNNQNPYAAFRDILNGSYICIDQAGGQSGRHFHNRLFCR